MDIGCGPGRYDVEFVRLGKEVTGIDMSQSMLDMATKLCANKELSGTASFIKGDYLTTQFDKNFDAAVMMVLVDYIENPHALFAKLKIDVKDLVIASIPKHSGFLALQKRTRYKIRGCPLFMYEKKQIEDQMRETNFSDCSIVETSREYFLKAKP